MWRGLFAYYFNDPNLLLSSYITSDSRIMIRRNIQERVRAIAPFLRLDHDPYLVISDGRMFWMQDAYTTSSYFPSAQPAQDVDINYIRNSVKVIVDAYNGTVDFYLMDTGDPVAATFQRIFPNLFTPFSAMPADLQKHIRYPEDLFLIQARLYQTYHMEGPTFSIIARISGSSRASRAAAALPRWPRITSSCGCPVSRRPSFSSCSRWCRAAATI